MNAEEEEGNEECYPESSTFAKIEVIPISETYDRPLPIQSTSEAQVYIHLLRTCAIEDENGLCAAVHGNKPRVITSNV